MPAKSKKQQMAAGAALAAKRGKRSKSSLKGASRQMASSMSESELRKMAKTKRKKLPKKKRRYYDLKPGHPDGLPSCVTAIASLKGSRLTLLVPVKGWSSTYTKNRIDEINAVRVVVIRYWARMFFIPKKNVYETANTPPTSKTNQITGGTVSLPANILIRRY